MWSDLLIPEIGILTRTRDARATRVCEHALCRARNHGTCNVLCTPLKEFAAPVAGPSSDAATPTHYGDTSEI